jgi:two-component system phosphate regulon sensor histidine kinase PhoR
LLSLFLAFSGIHYFHVVNRLAIRVSLILGMITVLLIVGVQVYFVHQAFNQEDRQLNQNIQVALRSVTEQMSKFNEANLPFDNPVQRLKSDYYVVNVNGFIDAEVLEHFLISEFQQRGIDLDFEFGIYDCSNDEFVYGRYVSFGQGQKTKPVEYTFSKYSEYLYYFGIYFPGRTKFILNNLGVWYFFSIVLLLVLAFFIYSQIIILKQRQLSEIQKDFINNLTHELRTPLSSILMSSEVFTEQDLSGDPDRIRQYGVIIKSKTNDLISQIDRILRLSDKTTKSNFNPVQLDLVVLLEQVYQDFHSITEKLNGSLILQVEVE